MKYYKTSIEDQETIINLLYNEQIIRIYSNREETIKNITAQLGNPTKKIKKSKTYLSGASWDIDFKDVGLIKKILPRNVFIDDAIVPKKKKVKKIKDEYYQVSLDNI